MMSNRSRFSIPTLVLTVFVGFAPVTVHAFGSCSGGGIETPPIFVGGLFGISFPVGCSVECVGTIAAETDDPDIAFPDPVEIPAALGAFVSIRPGNTAGTATITTSWKCDAKVDDPIEFPETSGVLDPVTVPVLPDFTATPTASVAQTATDTPVPTETPTAPPDTFTATATDTPTPTATSTATNTDTPTPPDTPTATPTNTSSATPTSSSDGTATTTATDTPTGTPTATPSSTPTMDVGPSCTGDCDRDGRVTISELVTGVNIALGSLGIDACPAFDADGNGRVAISELVAGVNNSLSGCPV